MPKGRGYMRTFPQSLAQINIKSKPCHPVQNTRLGLFFFFLKGLNKKFKEKQDLTSQDLIFPCKKHQTINTPLF